MNSIIIIYATEIYLKAMYGQGYKIEPALTVPETSMISQNRSLIVREDGQT